MHPSEPCPALVEFPHIQQWLGVVVAEADRGPPFQEHLLLVAARLAIPEVELVQLSASVQHVDPDKQLSVRIPDVSVLCLRHESRLFQSDGRELSAEDIACHLYREMEAYIESTLPWPFSLAQDFSLGSWQETIDPEQYLRDVGPLRMRLADRLGELRTAHMQAALLDRTTDRAPASAVPGRRI